MVLTRSEKRKLLALGINTNAQDEMQNVTTTQHPGAPTLQESTETNVQNTITTTATITPAVQQFLSLASGNNSVVGSQESEASITSPEYSSVTARNVRHEFSRTKPVRQEAQDNSSRSNEDVLTTLREELTRQLRDFQISIRQEIAQTVEQQLKQAEASNTCHMNNNTGIAPASTTVGYTERTTAYINTNPLQANRVQLPYNDMQPTRTAIYSRHEPQEAQSYPQVSISDGYTSQTNRLPDYFQSSHNKVDLSKWGIKFDGTTRTMSAEDFIFRLGILRQDYGCSFNDIIRSFHLLLEGQALNWYWNVRKLTPIRNWQDLETCFLMQYRRYENEFQIQKKIMDRRQAPGESFEDFYEAIIKLRNQQRTPYSERDLVEIMKSNLKPALSHLLFSVKIEGLNDFCQQAKRAEGLLTNQRQQQQQRPYATPRVNELNYVDDTMPDVRMVVEALAANNRYTCWNCKQVGHSFVDCPSPTRRIFCFRCGREGVVTPKCPKCQGNINVNRPQTGETRSTQT